MSRTLAQAFLDDPVMRWLAPDDTTRAKGAPRVFGAMIRHQHLAGGGCEVAQDGATVTAAALWDPPGRWKTSSWRDLLMAPSFLRGFGLGARRGMVVDALMKANHPEEPHWYLAVIGSDPAFRGGGHGHALMTSRLQRCDAEHAPAYLESSNEVNVPYYERFGFVVTGELVIPDGGPTMWQMWREPR